MKGVKMKKKSGVASFYIVTFSTLILMIIAASFATVIISEINRTSNDDLSQSAYDSALAGVEDAKVAFANYQRCLEKGATSAKPNNDGVVSCGEIVYWMDEKKSDCATVGHILGRIGEESEDEVLLGSTTTNTGSTETSLNQAYTCVTIEKELNNYRSELTNASDTKIVGIRFTEEEAKKLNRVRLSWYSIRPDSPFKGTTIRNGQAVFEPKADTGLIAPPVLEFQFVQTAKNFTVNQLISHVKDNEQQTDRGTLYLVPKLNEKNSAISNVSSKKVLESNNLQIKNTPFIVDCDKAGRDYSCIVDIDLPQPIGGLRSEKTLLFALSLPYNQPETDFSMEFFSCNGSNCGDPMSIHDTQIKIDSTGRANDLFRRVETRLESQDTTLPYPYYAMQILSNDSDYTVSKDMIVTCEHSLYDWGGVVNEGDSINNHGVNCQ